MADTWESSFSYRSAARPAAAQSPRTLTRAFAPAPAMLSRLDTVKLATPRRHSSPAASVAAATSAATPTPNLAALDAARARFDRMDAAAALRRHSSAARSTAPPRTAREPTSPGAPAGLSRIGAEYSAPGAPAGLSHFGVDGASKVAPLLDLDEEYSPQRTAARRSTMPAQRSPFDVRSATKAQLQRHYARATSSPPQGQPPVQSAAERDFAAMFDAQMRRREQQQQQQQQQQQRQPSQVSTPSTRRSTMPASHFGGELSQRAAAQRALPPPPQELPPRPPHTQSNAQPHQQQQQRQQRHPWATAPAQNSRRSTMPASLSAFGLNRFEERFDEPFAANEAASKAAMAYDAPLQQRDADALVVQPQPQLQTRALSVSSGAAERELLTQLQHSRTVIESLRKQVATAAGQLAETRRQLSLARTERMQLANAPPPSPEQLPPSAVAAAAEAERLELALAASNARADELDEQLVSANAAVVRRKSEIDELRAQSVAIQERMLREAISLSRESDEERRTLQLEFSQSVANSIDFEAQKQAMQQFAKAEASANAMRIKELREENQRLHAVNADLEGKLGHEAAFAQRSSGELRAELDAAQAALEVLRRQAEHEVGGLRNLLDEAKGNERRIRAVAEAEKGGAAELVASLQEEVRAAKNRSQAGASSAELKGQKLTNELTDVKADLEATRKEVT